MEAASIPAASGSATAAGHVLLVKDVATLIRANLVSVPCGFTNAGLPILLFPNQYGAKGSSWNAIQDSDLHLLFKYFLSVVPRTEQGTGFALIIDRRGQDWLTVHSVFQRIVTMFPARIREVYLITEDTSAMKWISQLTEEFLLDFEIIRITEPSELLHFIDSKCLPQVLGGQAQTDPEGWISLQEHVEGFSINARRIARRLAQFVGILNQEESGVSPSYVSNSLRELANKNRRNYRTLRKELEELTDHGLLMLKSLQRPDSNVMQRLAVQVLCKQLDQAWTYFNR